MSIREAEAVLKKYWGYESFRDPQIPIIKSILEGKDTIGLLTTGGGKSICFQVPAMMSEGTCIVVSPLIALMKDQVGQLNKLKIPSAAYYSDQSKDNQEKVIDYLLSGKLKFIYVSPERLHTIDFHTKLREVKINLLVVDEAHCISQWGYDFRPSYLQISEAYGSIGAIAKLALTATATPRVILDIRDKLELKNPSILVNSYFKSNLSYQISRTSTKVEEMVKWIKRIQGSGLIYVNRRATAEELVIQLKKNFGIDADYYHAGLSTELRNSKQEKWQSNPNAVMITTNAFGMGIDNPHVNYVIHYHFPASLEAYFQECGRAGRAGQNSYAISLISYGDTAEKRELIAQYPTIEEVQNTFMLLFNHFEIPYDSGYGRQFEWLIEEFISHYQLDPIQTRQSIQILKDSELLTIQDAFYKPDELQILLSNEEIAQISELYPEYAHLLQNLIRTYEGIFFKRKVNLYKLAKNYHYEMKELKSSLLHLASKEYIYFKPSTNKPTITFKCDKLASKDIAINSTLYYERKKIRIDQTQACIDYIEDTNRCRSQQLLTYLGEENSISCGICDVCIQAKQKVTKDDYIQIKEILLDNIDKNNFVAMDKLLKLLNKYPQQAVRKVIDRLIELNLIEKGNGEVFRKN